MPHLRFFLGERELLLHLLRPGRTIIGRSDQCDVALPSERLSRVHCTITEREEGWFLADRSRHGTRLRGEPVSRTPIFPGDTFEIGPYSVQFTQRLSPAEGVATETARRPLSRHEELVDVGDGEVTASRATLHISRGPRAGETVALTGVRTGVGGPGSRLCLDDTLPKDACFVRVVRGRLLVEPGSAAVFLAGSRVREITPALFGEELRCGPHSLVVQSETRPEPVKAAGFGAMVGDSAAIRRVFGVLTRMAGHDAPALLSGESGTGKELAARGLHDIGPRAEGPFVAVNCAGIPEKLFESELFGHEKGAFTGATHQQQGAFQRAEGGTLFLDEVGELALEAQAKLLRTLESGEVRRVGGGLPEFPDVRIVAATNRDLPAMVRGGTFREDLYFRLAVLTVRLPPLRARQPDIPAIARTLLARAHPTATLTDAAVDALSQYDWPGNVRELRNVLTRAFVLTGPKIDADDLSFNPLVFRGGPSPVAVSVDAAAERAAIGRALAKHKNNRTHAAQALGMPRSSLLYKMKKYAIS